MNCQSTVVLHVWPGRWCAQPRLLLYSGRLAGYSIHTVANTCCISIESESECGSRMPPLIRYSPNCLHISPATTGIFYYCGFCSLTFIYPLFDQSISVHFPLLLMHIRELFSRKMKFSPATDPFVYASLVLASLYSKIVFNEDL